MRKRKKVGVSLSFKQSGRDMTIPVLSFINISTIWTVPQSLLTMQKGLRFSCQCHDFLPRFYNHPIVFVHFMCWVQKMLWIGMKDNYELTNAVCWKLSSNTSVTSSAFCQYAFCSEHRMDLPDPLPQNELLTEALPSEHCNIKHIECPITIHPKINMYCRKTIAYPDVTKLQDTQRVMMSLQFSTWSLLQRQQKSQQWPSSAKFC